MKAKPITMFRQRHTFTYGEMLAFAECCGGLVEDRNFHECIMIACPRIVLIYKNRSVLPVKFVAL